MSTEYQPTDTLHGGPFDGLYIVDEWYGSSYLYVDCGSHRVAFYERDDAGLLLFRGYRPIGEGCMPHIRPEREEGRL